MIFLVAFGFDKDILNFDFYFMNLVNNTDLIIFSTYYSDNVLKKNVLVNPIQSKKGKYSYYID